MKVEYSNRAIVDLRKISADSGCAFGDRVAEALEARIRAVIDRISRDPLSAPELEQRPGVHVVPLVRYPFKIFYRISEDRVEFSTSDIPHGDHSQGKNESGNSRGACARAGLAQFL